MIIQVLSVPHYSSKPSPPPGVWPTDEMGRLAGAVFKEVQELLQPCSKGRQSRVGAPLHSQLTSQTQSSTHVKQAARQKTWRETSLKEISSTGCFRQGKYAFSFIAKFACQVAKQWSCCTDYLEQQDTVFYTLN